MVIKVGRGRGFGHSNRKTQGLGPVVIPPALDAMGVSAAAAYSLRKLRAAYAGAAIKVRRSSDSAVQDIGFDASGNLNTAALAAFVGSDSAFIDTWYDQSGNAVNAVQATAANQPRIVNAGVTDLFGTRPSIFATGTSQLTFTGTSSVSVVSVINSNASCPSLAALICAATDVSIRRTVTQANGWRAAQASFDFLDSTISFVNGANAAGVSDAAAMVANPLSTASVFSAIASGGAVSFANLFANPAQPTRSYIGLMPEVLLFGSALATGNRQTLERNQGAYYGVSVA